MKTTPTANDLHRLVKHAIDSGQVSSIEEAEARFHGYTLFIDLGGDSTCDAHQASLLTAIALGKRVFLGGVFVRGDLEVPLRCPISKGSSLREAVVTLGGHLIETFPEGCRRLSIGGATEPRGAGFHMRTVFSGWRGGVVPGDANAELNDEPVMPLSPMLASALAIGEAFSHALGEPGAGRLARGLSLWRPDQMDWRASDGAPPLRLLPARLWLIGLGHLGQAYLWALGLLPYPRCELELVLQDIDVITPSTESTSILSTFAMAGEKKTRAMAEWADWRGFSTSILERRFDASIERQEDEPAIALCGLDNALGRRSLDQVGFKLVVEAGLGSGHRDFRTMLVHTLPAQRTASELWPGRPPASPRLEGNGAYERLIAEGRLDRCGAALLAGKAVGAAFVGATAACLVVSEVLRFLNEGQATATVDLDLAAPEHRLIAQRSTPFPTFNPKYVLAVVR